MNSISVINGPSGARRFAVWAHGDQEYGEGVPYSFHLDSVAQTLTRFGYGRLTMAGYLHDVVEDSSVRIETIRAEFGDWVADIVHAVTNEPGRNRKERYAKTYPKILALGEDAVAVKLADRICNVEYSIATQSKLLKMYQKEHSEFMGSLYRDSVCWPMWNVLHALIKGSM
jgi:(p)ppGpp synthase/HD superfamily hydrolase